MVDADGIGRVWVVIKPPGFQLVSPDNPVTDLPTADLLDQGGGLYETVYNGFTEAGSYQLTLYATDALGNAGMPMNEQVDVENPLSRRAIVINAGETSDPGYAQRSLSSEMAYRALDNQSYGTETCPAVTQGLCHVACDSICYLTADSVLGRDASPTLIALEQAITGWGVDPDGDNIADVQDLTIYLTAASDGQGGYRLNATDSLSGAQLASWLDTAQALLPGTVTVIVDADDTESFLLTVGQQTSNSQILIGSTAAGQTAAMLQNGAISFSKFFWNQVFNGARTRQAFTLAASAIGYAADSPRAVLDDSGNGVANELIDGLLANRYFIGAGVLLAGDDPLIGSISSPALINASSYLLTVSEVTSTGQLAGVAAIISRPGQPIEELALIDQGGGVYQASVSGLEFDGPDVFIACYASDVEGNVSIPAIARALGDQLFKAGFE